MGGAWVLEGLEGRVLLSGNPTVYMVTDTSGSTSDTGSLPYAVIQANNNTNPEGSVIEFDPTVFTSLKTIALSSTLTLSETAGPEVIDGPGANLVTVSGGNAVQVVSVNSSVTATLSALTVTGGSAASSGGGIINNGILTIADSTIISNSAADSGGGIDNTNYLTINGSTIASNDVIDANGAGGGVENSGTLLITNTTIAENGVSGQNGVGGGIDDEGTLTTVNTTIAENSVTAGGSGGGFKLGKGSATLVNTIVALNTAGISQASDIALGSFGISVSSSSANNLIGTGGAGGLTSGTNGNQVGVANPGLASSLANNGGPTLTIALLSGSPAIDAGSTTVSGVTVPTTDQRGALRGPAGLHAGPTVDLGAYEASSSYLVTTSADSTDAGTLRAAVGWANESSNVNPSNLKSPGPNAIVFDTADAFATDQTITLSAGLGTLAMTNTGTGEAIDGPGASVVTVSGGGAIGVLSVASNVTATLSGLTISDGETSTNGAGVLNSGNLTINQSTFTGNSALKMGGAIANLGTMTVTDSTLSSNTALLGGGIENDSGALTVTGTAIVENSGQNNGGGIENDSGTMTVLNSAIEDNSASSDGGGVNNQAGTTDDHRLDRGL